MENIIEFISCVIDMVIIFIYFNGVLERKESIGKLFWGYFGISIAMNFVRSKLFLSLQENILISAIILLLIAFLCFDGSVLKKGFFTMIYAVAIMISEILTATLLSAFSKLNMMMALQ